MHLRAWRPEWIRAEYLCRCEYRSRFYGDAHGRRTRLGQRRAVLQLCSQYLQYGQSTQYGRDMRPLHSRSVENDDAVGLRTEGLHDQQPLSTTVYDLALHRLRLQPAGQLRRSEALLTTPALTSTCRTDSRPD